MTKYFKIRQLEKWQHYKDRRPPWIKLHTEILDDYKFAKLKDKDKCHLILLWLLASQCDNKLPCDPAWLAQRLNLTDKIDLESLQVSEFIELYQDASTMLAGCKQNADVETETKTQVKTETKYTLEFETFWKAYPKRGTEGKSETFDEWKLALKVTTIETIMEKIEQYKECQGVRDGYQVQANRWLKKRLWETEEYANNTRKDLPPWLQ